jgi:hypothetical protein
MSDEKKFSLFEAAGWFIRNVSLLRAEEYVLGCGVTHIVPKGAAIIRVQATKAFTPHRLIIPAHVAPSIVIDNFCVGDYNQLISTGAIPGEAFLASVETHLKLSVVPEKSIITLGVTNLFNSPVEFSVAIIGTVLQ